MKFKVQIGGMIKYNENDLIECNEVKDEYYYDHMFSKPFDLI